MTRLMRVGGGGVVGTEEGIEEVSVQTDPTRSVSGFRGSGVCYLVWVLA